MIREATKNDIPAIRSLMKSEPEFWQDEWRENAIDIGIASSNGLSFVWEDEGQVTGFICAHDVGFRAYISALIVAEKARGKGAGRCLLEFVEERLAQMRCSLVISDVWSNAEYFYRKLGWSPPGAILLRKNLKSMST